MKQANIYFALAFLCLAGALLSGSNSGENKIKPVPIEYFKEGQVMPPDSFTPESLIVNDTKF